jgi:Zn-dependent peptidase ImmA (M78 family)
MGHKKSWQSNIAQSLIQSQNANTVEEAIVRLIEQKLSMIQDKSKLDLALVASILGIDAKFRYVEMAQSARIIQNGGKCFIEVNKAHSKQRQRFSIGHEIGHRMLRGYKLSGVKARDSYAKTIEEQEEEDLCDLISTYLLGLSPDYLQPILQNEGLSFETIDTVSKRFDVSFEASARSLILHCDIPAAILYCIPQASNRQGIIQEFLLKRFYRSELFPIFPKSNTMIPHSISLNRAFVSENIVKVTEALKLDGVNQFRFACEAKKMPIYSDARAEQGIILLTTNPH